VEPHGAGRYAVLLTCPEFSVQLTDSPHIPTALVQLRSEFLHDAAGPRAAFASRRSGRDRPGAREFETWRSLVRRQGLSSADAIAAMARLAAGA
jgi:hypothetical protein